MRMSSLGFLAVSLMLASSGGAREFAPMQIVNGYSPSNPVFYNGRNQRKKKVNKLRLSHNAKLKRRAA